MRRSTWIPALTVTAVVATAGPAAADGASVERIQVVSTVVAVALGDDFPVGSLSRANCSFVQRVTRPDGSAEEIQMCELSSEPVMIPMFQGVAPDRALAYSGGACEWLSDFAFYKDGSDEYAASYRIVVTPSGRVIATSSYPAEPLSCA